MNLYKVIGSCLPRESHVCADSMADAEDKWICAVRNLGPLEYLTHGNVDGSKTPTPVEISLVVKGDQLIVGRVFEEVYGDYSQRPKEEEEGTEL
jgi:hypothetical protein